MSEKKKKKSFGWKSGRENEKVIIIKGGELEIHDKNSGLSFAIRSSLQGLNIFLIKDGIPMKEINISCARLLKIIGKIT